ncbi:hypothetical protein EDD16DRAFT_402557 [Pisolithus croceorrhizus]|nr:hypothetical protein EDD16DRAFT_402557 [Pisolithus croceorrhizus]KAI6117779.1 hypothetical protein EV401DRAFT_1967811 [Pisolithus croceorrhizus]
MPTPIFAWSPATPAVYTFIATLVILLAVASAIVGRSFILRRRHHRLLDHPIRQGGVAAGGRLWTFGNDISPEVRRGVVREKPRVWQTWIQSFRVVGGAGGRLTLADIKPVSVAYIGSGKEEPPPQHVGALPLPPPPLCGARRTFGRCSRSMESPTPPPSSRTHPPKLRVFVLVAMPTPESSSFFSPYPADKDEGTDGSLHKAGGLPPIEMGAVEMAARDD